VISQLGTAAPDPGDPPVLATRSWAALGSYVELVAGADRADAAQRAAAELLDRVDRACSRFRDDSDLVRANRGAGRWVRVDPLLARAVLVAVATAEETGGLVDPTLGRMLGALGYDRDLALVRAAGAGPAIGGGDDPAGIPAAPSRDAWRSLRADADGAVLVPAGAALDLGATGKAFAADLIAAEVPDAVGVDLVVSLGGDVAVGRRAGSPPCEWLVEVTEHRPAATTSGDVETVAITIGGIATSSTIGRRWRHRGSVMHHLLDPRTGRPVHPVWRTVTVAAGDCVAANTASTVSIVLGEQAEGWLAERDLPARLVGADGRVVRVGGWPEPVACG
jgi:thiamine biosynthesis lipoprotein